MTVLIFLVVLFVLILVHEWGHFIVAKKTGMRVDEFGIGFPPKLYGIKKGGTEYTINALPIGGFVRIFGEDAADAERDAEEGRDVSGAFSSKSKWAQVAVLLAGVSMNVLFAWALIAFVYLIGVPSAIDEKDVSPHSSLIVTEVVSGSPAAAAHIPVGAKILRYGTKDAYTDLTPTAFREYTLAEGTSPLSITYEVGKQETTVAVTPKIGLISDEPSQPAIGVALAVVATVHKPFFEAVTDASITTYQTLIGIAVGLGTLLIAIAHLHADLSQVAGPVGIVGMVGQAAEFGFASLLMFTAVISLNLAVINLLPFPALDGGRLLFVIIEAVTQKRMNPTWVARINTAGFALLIALMIAVTYSDIAKLLK